VHEKNGLYIVNGFDFLDDAYAEFKPKVQDVLKNSFKLSSNEKEATVY
jgi:hypothetical protein